MQFRLRDDCPLWCAVPHASTTTQLCNFRRTGHGPHSVRRAVSISWRGVFCFFLANTCTTTTRRLLAAGSRARVLILTTFGLDEYVYEALSAGAIHQVWGLGLIASVVSNLISNVPAVMLLSPLMSIQGSHALWLGRKISRVAREKAT